MKKTSDNSKGEEDKKSIRTASERESDKRRIKEQKRKLQEEMSKLEQAEKEIHEEELQDRKNIAAENLKYLREHKDVILSLLKHSRTSCSDDNPCNGYTFSGEYARCEKCYLIEILNGEWGDDFEIDFSVTINEIK